MGIFFLEKNSAKKMHTQTKILIRIRILTVTYLLFQFWSIKKSLLTIFTPENDCTYHIVNVLSIFYLLSFSYFRMLFVNFWSFLCIIAISVHLNNWWFWNNQDHKILNFFEMFYFNSMSGWIILSQYLHTRALSIFKLEKFPILNFSVSIFQIIFLLSNLENFL